MRAARALMTAAALWVAPSSGAAGAGPAAPAPLPVVKGAAGLKAHLARRGVQVVHFWATWCPPCREEWPSLAPVLDRARARGARVLTVSLDAPKDASAAAAYLAQVGARPEEAILLDADALGVTTLLSRAWDGELPATFVLSKGQPVHEELGRADLRRLTAVLDRALPGHPKSR